MLYIFIAIIKIYTGMSLNTNIDITENAVTRISSLLKGEPEGSKFRIEVDGGGCNGFQYKMDFDTKVNNEEDILFSKDGVEIVVDKTSLEFLSGSRLDYIISLGAEHFEIQNPNAASSCGCGNSFSV
jgi:iron-sulfur cluster insertion protein